jgi:hypothetical protein
VAICILADNALGDDRLSTSDGPARVELELLSPEASRCISYDCSNERTVMAARRTIAATAHNWHRDDEFRATPGTHCAGCEVSRWCPSAFGTPVTNGVVTVDGVGVDTRTGEVVDARLSKRAPSTAETAAMMTLMDTSSVPDDEDVPSF